MFVAVLTLNTLELAVDDHWTLGDLKSVITGILHKTPTLDYLFFTPVWLPFCLNLSVYH